MCACIIQRRDKCGQGFRKNTDRTPDFSRKRRAALIDIDLQVVLIPLKLAGPKSEPGGVSVQMPRPPFRHGPQMPWLTVQCHIDGAMVLGIDLRTPSFKRPGVVRGKHASYKCNDAQRISSVIAEGIDVPPKVTAGIYGLIKPRCAMVVSAANRPESAAIGTPGPGCTLPPAR